MSIKTRFLIWATVVNLMMVALCVFAFRENAVWLVYSIIACVAVMAVITMLVWSVLSKSDKVSTMCLDMLNEQDFSSRLSRVGFPEGDRMIDVYNRMITELREQRLLIRGKNEFLDLLVEAESMGIIVLDFNMFITSVNPAAENFIQIPAAELIGFRLNKFDNLMMLALSTLQEDKPQVVEVNGVNRYRCSLRSYIDNGFRHPFILIEELTHELIAAEKRASEKIIRTMSHEVNNTLSSINSNLSVLLEINECFPEKLRGDIIRALHSSIERSDNLCRFVSAFADIVKMPPPQLAPTEINVIVQNTLNLMQSKFADAGVNCTLQLCEQSPVINADAGQMEQALINILKNALEASLSPVTALTAVEDHVSGDIPVSGEVTVITTNSPKTLIIRDTGCGIPETIRNKIFTPFFTTKPGGQGIGLMLVNEILLNHKFSFELETKDGSTEFLIYL